MAVTLPTKAPGTWRYEDLFDLPDDGRRWEIIDGELYELPAANLAHGNAVMNLIALLLPAMAALGGRIFTAPVDVFFPGADPVQPDILLVLPTRLGVLEERGVEGPPDLAVEVVSPSNRRHDRVRKLDLYARGGIREYWLVDPEAATVEVLTLIEGAYRRHVLAAGTDPVTSPLLPELSFPAAVVFAAELPR